MKKQFLLGALVLANSAAAFANSAVPYKYTSCLVESKVKHPENSTDLYFSRDCNVAYVLPPKVGKIYEYHASTPRVDKKDCQAVDNIRSSITSLTSSVQSKHSTVEYLNKQREIKIKEQDKLRDNLLILEEVISRASLRLQNAVVEEADARAKVEEIQASIDSCSSTSICNLYQLQLSKAVKVLESRTTKVRNAKALEAKAKSEKTREQARIDDNVQRVDGYYAEISKLDLKLNEEIKELESYLDGARKKLGAYVVASYDLDTAELVNNYNRLNANLGVNFKMMPLNAHKLSFTMSISNNIDGDHQVHIPISSDPQLNFSDSNHYGTGPSGEAKIALNAMATCQLMDEEGNVDPDKLSNEKLFTASFLYQFDVGLQASYSVNYNIKQLYEVIKSSGSRGGFFSRKSWTHVDKTNEYRALFTIDFRDEGSNALSREDKDRIRADERAFALEKLFKEFMTLANNDGQLPVPNVAMPDENAATTSANLLAQCPHLYCQVGAGILKIADSMWGSAKVSNHFRDERYFEYNYDVSDQTMRTLTRGSGYKHVVLD